MNRLRFAVSAVLVTQADGDTFTSNIVAQPGHGTLVADTANAGRFTYTPTPDFNGTDSFQLHAITEAGASASGTVTVTVNQSKIPPVAMPTQAHTTQGTAVRIQPVTSDIDGEKLAVSIVTQPDSGTATANSDGSILYTPPNAFIGTTSFTYQVADPDGLTATSTISVSVGFSTALLFYQASGSGTGELFFTDGTRTFQVNAPLVGGETIQSATPASTAPVVYYTTRRSNVLHLFRVDLRTPGSAVEVGQPTAFPGVGAYTISADGAKVVYDLAGRLNLLDLNTQSGARDLGDSSQMRGPTLNPGGTRLFYNGLITQPYLASGALFSLSTAPGSSPVQVTPTVASPVTTSGIAYLTRDEHRLYYDTQDGGNGHSVLLGVDPDVVGYFGLSLFGSDDRRWLAPLLRTRLCQKRVNVGGSSCRHVPATPAAKLRRQWYHRAIKPGLVLSGRSRDLAMAFIRLICSAACAASADS